MTNISIFQVKKEIEEDKTKFKITHATAILKSVFEDLGIRNSSVLLANCTIWVEGVTDKLYLKAYMRKYLQELSLEDTDKHKKYDLYKEDLHYIFAEYQGSNIVHWDFSNREQNDDLDNEGKKTTLVEALCGNALLIADGDIDNKGTRVADLTQIMGERFILLEAKEIENYIPSSILKETVKLLWSKKYKKSENTIIKWNDITQESYFNNIGIGDYLESLVENAKANTQYFSSQTDTINQKVKFCETAFYFMRDLPTTEWQLTSKLRTLCQKIFEHISSNNQA